ncbi:MAG: rhomboid family intramembrane serine protease [Deltaproteobacteria bacterium]|nr:rhomboid family intramembrane serine protease [Deltaproteobacteria bacterium]MBW2359864.1 rhomboid family intramembrane serine protease [Deltaproteobacteria bacterium]
MFPIKDDNPHFLTPVVTYALVLANAASWFLVQGLGQESALVSSVCQLGLIPGEVLGRLPPGTQVPLGRAACVLGDPGGWHTALTSMFLHGGWMHLIGNMWFLWIFGNNVEDSMGHTRFLIFYVLCGLVAAGLQMASSPDSPIPMVGASGAIGGVMGAYIVLYPKVRVHMLLVLGFYVTRVVVPAIFMLGYWFAMQLLGGAVALGRAGQGGVAFWAHVGGFAAGALLIFVFRDRRLVDRHPYHGWSPRRRR